MAFKELDICCGHPTDSAICGLNLEPVVIGAQAKHCHMCIAQQREHCFGPYACSLAHTKPTDKNDTRQGRLGNSASATKRYCERRWRRGDSRRSAECHTHSQQ